MKKTFKIIISAIVCLALLIVPMTVNAAEEGIDYNINYETYLTEGTNVYTIDSTVPYTVYYFYPSAVGDYTFTSDAKMGIVSYIDMWVQNDPTDENVNLNEITWPCTDINQAIMIALKSDLAEVSITVSWKDSTVVDIPWTIYENKKTPEKFEMPDFVDVDAFEDGYVDFEDSEIDDAVLGDDGYYHLNEKDGPVLFINLNDPIMSMYTMVGYGSLAAVYYDDGAVTKKVDYTDAFNQYVSALPTDSAGIITSYYYPLNADLIEMFKEVGATHDWYGGDTPWVYASEDAWLFACYFDENVTSMNSSADSDSPIESDGELDTDVDDIDPGDDDDTDAEEETSEEKTSEEKTSEEKTTEEKNEEATTGATEEKNEDSTQLDDSKKSPATADNLSAISLLMISTATLVFATKKKV